MTVVLAVIEIIGTHNRPSATFLHCGLECWEIDFVKGTVVHYGIGLSALELLIVHSEVLYAGCYAVFLNALYVWNHHLSRQEWVFAHILEVASIIRSTADVDARTEKYVFLTIAGLFAYARTVE